MNDEIKALVQANLSLVDIPLIILKQLFPRALELSYNEQEQEILIKISGKGNETLSAQTFHEVSSSEGETVSIESLTLPLIEKEKIASIINRGREILIQTIIAEMLQTFSLKEMDHSYTLPWYLYVESVITEAHSQHKELFDQTLSTCLSSRHQGFARPCNVQDPLSIIRDEAVYRRALTQPLAQTIDQDRVLFRYIIHTIAANLGIDDLTIIMSSFTGDRIKSQFLNIFIPNTTMQSTAELNKLADRFARIALQLYEFHTYLKKLARSQGQEYNFVLAQFQQTAQRYICKFSLPSATNIYVKTKKCSPGPWFPYVALSTLLLNIEQDFTSTHLPATLTSYAHHSYPDFLSKTLGEKGRWQLLIERFISKDDNWKYRSHVILSCLETLKKAATLMQETLPFDLLQMVLKMIERENTTTSEVRKNQVQAVVKILEMIKGKLNNSELVKLIQDTPLQKNKITAIILESAGLFITPAYDNIANSILQTWFEILMKIQPQITTDWFFQPLSKLDTILAFRATLPHLKDRHSSVILKGGGPIRALLEAMTNTFRPKNESVSIVPGYHDIPVECFSIPGP